MVPLDASALQLQAAVQAVAQELVILPKVHMQRLYENRVLTEVRNNENLDETLTAREREVSGTCRAGTFQQAHRTPTSDQRTYGEIPCLVYL